MSPGPNAAEKSPGPNAAEKSPDRMPKPSRPDRAISASQLPPRGLCRALATSAPQPACDGAHRR